MVQEEDCDFSGGAVSLANKQTIKQTNQDF